MAHYVIGTVYKDLKKYEEAETYYNAGISLAGVASTWYGRIYAGLTNIYTDREEHDKAITTGLKSREIFKKEGM